MTRINVGDTTAATPGSAYDHRLDDPAYPNFKAIPHCIYFYYVGPRNDAGYRKVVHYYDPGTNQPLTTHAEVKAKVEALVTNARIPNEANRLPPPIGENWNFVVWDRKSYLAIFVDDPDVTLLSPAIDFNQRPGTDDTYNHSFFDAWEDVIDSRPVIFCINHMKMDDAGNDLNFDAQYFHFDLNTDPPLRFWVAYPDSGGTNMGPPLGPP